MEMLDNSHAHILACVQMWSLIQNLFNLDPHSASIPMSMKKNMQKENLQISSCSVNLSVFLL